MEARIYDWKDVANAQFDKALTLALLITLFLIMVTPKVDVQRQKVTTTESTIIDIPPEQREKMKEPDVVKPVVDIVISDVLNSGKSEDIADMDAILKQFDTKMTDVNVGTKLNASNDEERMGDFQIYEDPPEPINPTPPEYPAFAKANKIQGRVVLQVDVFKDGTVGHIIVLKSLLPGPGGLDEAAIEAVKKWRFQPGKSGGKPVDTQVNIPITFSLTNR